ncbi:hypothetical protein HDV06_000305 [Boothiomyces sp. JEL0866]|nr:hypothetical protein HDV06_000305 [Boothiomyces sp. JEL0866]
MAVLLFQKILPNDKIRNWAKYNVTLSLLLFIFGTALEGIVIGNSLDFINSTFEAEKSGASSMIIVYFSLFIFGLAFQFIGAFDANLHLNTMQVLAVAIFNTMNLGYSIIQIYQTNHLKDCANTFQTYYLSGYTSGLQSLSSSCYFQPVWDNGDVVGTKSLANVSSDIASKLYLFDIMLYLEITIVCILLIFNVIGMYFSYKCYQQHGWSVYETHGADIAKKSRNALTVEILQRYHIFILLLKLNSFFFLGLMTQALTAYFFHCKVSGTPLSTGMTIFYAFIVLIATVLYYLVGYFGATRASLHLISVFYLFIAANFAVIGYIYYKSFGTSEETVQFVSSILTLTISVFLLKDFSKGLSDIVKPVSPSKEKELKVPAERFELD